MSMELELKYLVGAADAATLPDLLKLYAQITVADQYDLLNAYFDTPTHWFRRHDCGLRTRQKNNRFEQTIKLAGQQHGALHARPEYNVPCVGVVPELALFPLDIWPDNPDITVLQSQLIELFRTDFQRQRWLLTLPDATVEVVYDKGEVRAGERRQAISELELELISGPAEALFALAEFLLNALPMRTGWLSKAARGYQLYQNKTTPRPAVLTPDRYLSSPLLSHLQRLQQLESCYNQELAPELLLEAEQELQHLATILTDEGQQLLASQARAIARRMQDDAGLVFNSQEYHLLLLKLSALLL